MYKFVIELNNWEMGINVVLYPVNSMFTWTWASQLWVLSQFLSSQVDDVYTLTEKPGHLYPYYTHLFPMFSWLQLIRGLFCVWLF